MSTQELEHTEDTDQRPERAVAVRRFAVEVATGKGRTVSMRIAPFREIAVCADGLGGVRKGIPYEEELMPGLYDKQLAAAHRVLLNVEHQQGIGGIIGHALALRSASDGYHGDFRVQETQDGDKALDLVEHDVFAGASVESYWIKSVRSAAGVVQRVRGHLEAVALCREGAYPSALVTGLRADELIEDQILLDEALLPVPSNPELIERCRKLGIRVPQRYQAHPAGTDTSASSDTSEDGTRQTTGKSSKEEHDEHDPERA